MLVVYQTVCKLFSFVLHLYCIRARWVNHLALFPGPVRLVDQVTSFQRLSDQIFQQVVSDISSQLKGESPEDRSRNEGMCAPFVNSDEMYRTRGTMDISHSWSNTCNVVNSNIQLWIFQVPWQHSVR